jgi:hypothetical protein
VEVAWELPVAPPGAPAAPRHEQPADAAVLVRIAAATPRGVAEAHGQVVEALHAQLLPHGAAAAAGDLDVSSSRSGSSRSAGSGGCVRYEGWALESDRPRLQQSLRRLQQLQGRVTQLRALLGEALRLRDACDGGSSGCGKGCDVEAGDMGRLLATAAQLRDGVEQAYGQMLLASTDAFRVVTA